jgi:hypothetical protein
MRGRSAQPNSFLNNKHHLLENAIINKEFQEPRRKVILKNERYPGSNSDPNNSEYFNKIIDLEESDSENYFNNNGDNEEFSQEYDEENDDEEYNINAKDENWINNNSRNKKKNYGPKHKNTELDSPL